MISKNNDGMTPLIMAVSMDWDEGVDVLLGTQILDKADITNLAHEEIIEREYEIPTQNRRDEDFKTFFFPHIVLHPPEDYQWTVFTLTVAVGWVGGLKLLMKAGVSLPLNKINEYNVFYLAITSGNEEIPILMLDAMDDRQKSEVVNHIHSCMNIESYISYAIHIQFCRLVRRLLHVDADHVGGRNGYNILHLAAEYAQPQKNGEPDLWDILLEENNPRHNLIKEMFLESTDNSYGDTLHIAAWAGNLYSIRVLSERYNKSLTAKDENGETPLHCAATIGSDEVIRYIVDQDVRTLMATDNVDHTPLAIALIEDTNVELLLDLGVPRESMHETITPYEINKSYGTTLCVAAKHGNLKCVRTLHELYGVSLTTKDREGKTPLHHAAEGRDEIIRYIVNKDVKTLMATDHNDHTPLAIALSRNTNVELLLDLGIPLHKFGGSLNESTHETITTDNINMSYGTTLCVAVRYGNLKCVRTLHELYGVSLTTKDLCGKTPLHCTTEERDKIIRYINEKGRKTLTDTDGNGYTPLAIAIKEHAYGSTVELLLELGASHLQLDDLKKAYFIKNNSDNDEDFLSCNPLNVQYGKLETFEILYEKYSDLLTTKDRKGWTPLHYAAAHSRDEVIRYIVIENSKTLKTKDNKGNTPLITAIVHKNESSVKLLLELGASLAETICKEAEDFLPPAETPNGSHIPSSETPHVAYVPPEDTPNGSHIPSSETPHVAYVPPEDTPNGSHIPLAERHAVPKIPPAETSNESLLENNCKSLFATLSYKEGHEEKSALQLILNWWKNENLAKDVLDSCIKGNVKDDSVGSKNNSEGHVQLNFEIFQSEDGRWFNFVHQLQGRRELLLHPVTESLVWQSTLDVKHQIYYNSAVHCVLLWVFYMLQQYWRTNEGFTLFEAVCLPFLFLWLIFVYIQDLRNQARWSPSWFLSVVLFCSIFAAMVLTASRFFTSSELVITLSKLLFYPVFLRIVSYFDQAILPTFLHMVKAVGKILKIAVIFIIIFVAVFMIKPDLQDPLNDFGKTLVSKAKIVSSYIVEEVTFDTIGKVIACLTAVGHLISKIDLDVDWIKKYFEVKNKSDVGEAIIRQATVLEALSKSYLFNKREFTKSIYVFHDRKLDSKNHGSFIFGNRIWECVAEWYVKQSDPGREEDKKKFKEAKKKHCPLHTCLCEG